MALASIQRGLIWPTIDYCSSASPMTIDATGEKAAMLGELYIEGRQAGPKTLSTGTIQFLTGTSVFADGATTLDVGIQGVSAVNGPIMQPDGVFTVKKTLTGGAGITTSAWNTVTMNSGSASLSHGDKIAVVWDMTNRAGADSVIVNGANAAGQLGPAGGTGGFLTTNTFLAGAWQTGAGVIPNVVIVFDDGTLGWLDFTLPLSAFAGSEAYADATNPDERGMIFQVPFDCKIDAVWAQIGASAANGDFDFKLYSDPTGTPSLITSVSHLAEHTGNVNNRRHLTRQIAEQFLSKNTDYVLAVRATGAGNAQLQTFTLGNTAFRAAFPAGTSLKKATRNNSAGAFTAESPAVTLYNMGVRISQIDDGTGGGGGLLRHPGMNGGLNA